MTSMEGLPNDGERRVTPTSAEERLIELAERMLAEAATESDVRELEWLMRRNAGLRRRFLQYALVHGQLALTSDGLPPTEARPDRTKSTLGPSAWWRPKGDRGRAVAAMALAAAVVLVVSAAVFYAGAERRLGVASSALNEPESTDTTLADHYDNRKLPVQIIGVLETDPLRSISPTTLTVHQGETQLMTVEGTDVEIEGPAMFGASSTSEGVLFEGAVHANLKRPDTNYSIQTSNLRFLDQGTNFRVATMDHNRIRVDVIEGQVEVQSRVRLPLYYWNFDEDASSDTENAEPGLRYFGERIRHSPGLVGSGSLRFENQSEAQVRIESGAGVNVCTGDMACSSGISIEALVVCRWSGRFKDYDEIFRKEDGVHRMLLSFQNDGNLNRFDVPEVPPGPCLSFGLHLEKSGYSELDMPLDGRDGRPSLRELTDGKPHHLVATYDSFSGRKAIYVDGRLRFAHDFPIGTLILNGGPAPAVIGNHQHKEPFTGLIDEVAFYDLALSPEEISEHYSRAMRGQAYFSVPTGTRPIGRWRSISLVEAGTSRFFDTLSGLALP